MSSQTERSLPPSSPDCLTDFEKAVSTYLLQWEAAPSTEQADAPRKKWLAGGTIRSPWPVRGWNGPVLIGVGFIVAEQFAASNQWGSFERLLRTALRRLQAEGYQGASLVRPGSYSCGSSLFQPHHLKCGYGGVEPLEGEFPGSEFSG